jgi:hypothetical protein
MPQLLTTNDSLLHFQKQQIKMDSMNANATNGGPARYTVENNFHKTTGAPPSNSITEHYIPAEPGDNDSQTFQQAMNGFHQHDDRKRKANNEQDTELSKPNSRFTRYSEEVLVSLSAWLADHVQKPYPTRQQMDELAQSSGLTYQQVNTWFTNIRKRKLKPKKAIRKRTENSNDFDDLGSSRKTSGHRYQRASFVPMTPPISKQTAYYANNIPRVTPITSDQVEHDDDDEDDDEVVVVKVVHNIKRLAPLYEDMTDAEIESILTHRIPVFCADDSVDCEVVADADIDALFNDDDEAWGHRLNDIFLVEEERMLELEIESAAQLRMLRSSVEMIPKFKKQRVDNDGYSDLDFVKTGKNDADLDGLDPNLEDDLELSVAEFGASMADFYLLSYKGQFTMEDSLGHGCDE